MDEIAINTILDRFQQGYDKIPVILSTIKENVRDYNKVNLLLKKCQNLLLEHLELQDSALLNIVSTQLCLKEKNTQIIKFLDYDTNNFKVSVLTFFDEFLVNNMNRKFINFSLKFYDFSNKVYQRFETEKNYLLPILRETI